MPNYSFYGGRPGFSFIIAKSFPSIAEMVASFKQGPMYTAVHYDEHVLINTKNKNNPDNGKLYRRGYDYTNELGGAIYVGTIVGPAGKAPILELTTIEEVKKKQEVDGYDSYYKEGSYSVPASLIPGKDGDTYNDKIEWACCSVRDENGEESIAYIGFKFPYLVVDFVSQSVNPYYNRSNDTDTFTNQDLIDRIDSKDHPFYEKWHINVPKGIKGDAFKNLRVVVADDTIQDYEGRQDDIDNEREILVYDYYHYDKDESGEPIPIYLGDYNMIDEISFDEEGTIIINYSHDDNLEYTKLIKWIKQVTLDKDNGHFTVEYNHDEDKDGNATIYETDLSWVNNIEIAEDGTVTVGWSTGESEDLPVQLRWVSDITIDDDGTITISYNNGGPKTYDDMLKYIDHIYFDETDNKFHVVYNTQEDEEIDNVIKFIDNVYIYDDPDDENSDYRFHVVYNTGEDEPIGAEVNYVEETDIDKTDYHFLVYYSNANYRNLIPQDKSRTHNGKDGWLDLGSLKDDSGVLVGFNIPLATAPNLDNIVGAIEYLNNNYPDGLTDIKYYGKIVTIGDASENKKFYAYDYDTYKWYYLGSFNNDDSTWILIAEESAPLLDTLKSKVMVGGAWFIVEGEDD